MSSPGNEDGHYSGEIEPIDIIEDRTLEFAPACVVKYLSRHRLKGRLLDIKKADWYLERMANQCYEGVPSGADLFMFFAEHEMSISEACVILLVICADETTLPHERGPLIAAAQQLLKVVARETYGEKL